MDILSILQSHATVPENIQANIEKFVHSQGLSYEDALTRTGISPEIVRAVFAEYYGVPSLAFNEDIKLSQDILSYVSKESARHYSMVPMSIEDGVLLVATNDPDNLQIREVLNFIATKHNIAYKLAFMLQADLEQALDSYESLTGEVGEALGSLENELDAEIQKNKKEDTNQLDEQYAHLKEDAPVTKIVATILRYAVDGGASDIHIEPHDDRIVVRFRVDGQLQKSLELPNAVKDAVVARVKILASARLDEKRKPQDGRFSANFDGRKIDFRVSIFPTSHGEKVVMRILDNERGITNLEHTGISSYNLEVIRRVLNEPYGIILISGPTGSGKSTTLYAMMDEVDKESKNVLSLEDPVEYNIKNVSQSQMRPEIGYTFANGLRTALRQDPDIIMVGEIRDRETAQLAIQAALTGHLVLSTIHTNNSIGVVPRLIDMGVDPYLIAPTLKLAIAQRLARKICPGTGKPVSVEGSIRNMIDTSFASLPARFRSRIPPLDSMLHPEPSPGCSSGTKGRVAVMETFEVTDEIQDLILKGGSEEQMFLSARQNGFMTMHEDAIIKALGHVIPFEEMNVFGTKVGVEASLPEIEDSPKTVNEDIDIPAASSPVDNLSLT